MTPSQIAGLEFTLTVGGVLGLAVWDVVRLRRDVRATERETADRGLPRLLADSTTETHVRENGLKPMSD